MVERITDIHMHIVPGVDDGAENITMPLEMLRRAYAQGVRSVFCTSHDWDSSYDRDIFFSRLENLRERIAA